MVMVATPEIGRGQRFRFLLRNTEVVANVSGFSFWDDVMTRDARIPGFGSASYPYPLARKFIDCLSRDLTWEELFELCFGVEKKNKNSTPIDAECPQHLVKQISTSDILGVCGKIFPVWCSNFVVNLDGKLHRIENSSPEGEEGTLARALLSSLSAFARGAFEFPVDLTFDCPHSILIFASKDGIEYLTHPRIHWNLYGGMYVNGTTSWTRKSEVSH